MLFWQQIFSKNNKSDKHRIMLMTRLKSLAEIKPVFATSTARPVIPPNVKLFVNLKK